MNALRLPAILPISIRFLLSTVPPLSNIDFAAKPRFPQRLIAGKADDVPDRSRAPRTAAKDRPVRIRGTQRQHRAYDTRHRRPCGFLPPSGRPEPAIAL